MDCVLFSLLRSDQSLRRVVNYYAWTHHPVSLSTLNVVSSSHTCLARISHSTSNMVNWGRRPEFSGGKGATGAISPFRRRLDIAILVAGVTVTLYNCAYVGLGMYYGEIGRSVVHVVYSVMLLILLCCCSRYAVDRVIGRVMLLIVLLLV